MLEQTTIIDELNPTPIETLDQAEEGPIPELIPTTEHIAAEGEPDPKTPPAEIPVQEFKPFDTDMLVVPKMNNFVPRETYVPQEDNDGSVFMANLENENTIWSWATSRRAKDVSEVDYNKFNFAEHLKPEQVPDLKYYAFAMSQEEIDDITVQIARERKNDAIMQAHPIQSLLASAVLSPLELTNYFPGGVAFNRFKTIGTVARGAIAVSASNLVSTVASEVALHNSQLTRTTEESVWNVATSTLLGAAIGAGAARLGPEYQVSKAVEQQARKQIMDIYTDTPPSVGAARVQELDNSLANMPEITKKAMFMSPGARLESSEFKSANLFKNQILEGSLYTEANTKGQTHGQALETMIKTRKGAPREHILEYNNAYLAEIGIEGGAFKKTRAFFTEIAGNKMSAATFAQKVAKHIFMATDDTNPNVQRGVVAIRKIAEDDTKVLRELGKLKEGEGTATSAGHLTIIPNKQKILEEGGRNARGPGTYPETLKDEMKKTMLIADEFRQGPIHTAIQDKIKVLKNRIKGLPPEERTAIEKGISESKKKIKDVELRSSEKLIAEQSKLDMLTEHYNENIEHWESQISEHKKEAISIAQDFSENWHKDIELLDNEIKIYKKEIATNEAKVSKLNTENEVNKEKIKHLKEDSKSYTAKDNKIKGDTAEIERLKNEISVAKLYISELKSEKSSVSEIVNLFKNQSKGYFENLSLSKELKKISSFPVEQFQKFVSKVEVAGIKPIKDRKQYNSFKTKLGQIDVLLSDINRETDVLRKHTKKTAKLDKEFLSNASAEAKKYVQDIKDYEKGKRPLKQSEKKALREEIRAHREQIKEDAIKYNPLIINRKTGKLWKMVDDDVLWSSAINVIDKQLSMEEDTLLNPMFRDFGNPNSLKGRVLMVPQEKLFPWHNQDPVKISLLNNRALSPFIAKELFAREKGFNDFDEMKVNFSNRLKAEYDEKSVIKTIVDGKLVITPKTGKEAAKLKKEFDTIREDMQATLDILDGIYGQGENTITSTKSAKFLQGFRDFNYVRMMGSITLQSFNDIGSIMIRNGVFNTMYHGLLPMLTDMRHMSKRDLKAIHYGMDSELGMISQRYMDQEPLSTNPGIFTRSMDTLKSAFGDLTLFNQWNGFAQRLSMNTSINHTLDTIHRIINGQTVKKKDRTRLAQLGIHEEYFDYIARKTSGPNNISTNGTRVADWTTWNPTTSFEANALRDFQAATIRDVDQTVLTVGAGDKPLWTHDSIGKTITQFKGFGFASTNKITLSAIQRRHDAEVYTGITAMLTLGAMSYAATQYIRGKEPDFSLGNLVLESIDRSGIMGIMMEGFDISQSMGIIPGQGVSRYQSRGIQGALLGPTGGTAVDISILLGKIVGSGWNKIGQELGIDLGDMELTTSDINKILKLLPLSNLAYINWLDEQLVTRIGEAFNLKETRAGH